MSALDNLPLTPKQIVSFSKSESAWLSIWDGAVRSGKTIASLVSLMVGIAKAPSSGEIVIVGKTLQTIERNVISPLQDASIFGILTRQVFHVAGSNVAVILGRRVNLVGANDSRAEEKVRGMTCCLVYVDEASLLSENFWNMILSRLSVKGARAMATTNPDARSHWLRKEWLIKAGEKGIYHAHFTLDDNTFLDPEFVARTKANYSGLWYKRFILGEWINAEGAVYDMWNPDTMVVDELPQILRWPAVAVDYGTASVFAALALGLGADGRLYFTHEWRWDAKKQGKQLTDSQYFDRLVAWKEENKIRPQFNVIDPSAASFKTEMLFNSQDGPPTSGDNAVLDGIRLISSLLGKGLLRVHSRCTGLIDEFPGYSWNEKAALKGEDKPLKVDDHSLDAGRYGVKTTEYLWSGQLRDSVREVAA